MNAMRFFFYAYCYIVLVFQNVFAALPLRIDYFTNTRPSGWRLVGGMKAKRYQFPYQISLQHNGRHICGGALINETRVLTAAHCKISSRGRYEVIAGMLKLKEKHEDVQKIRVKRFITHPRFDLFSRSVQTNDIAFLVLSKPVKLSNAVQLIALPTKEQCESLNTVMISGWGFLDSVAEQVPKILRWAELPRITNKECSKNLIRLRQTSKPLDTTMTCTISLPGKNNSACGGDSGGPLVFDSAVVGVVSWGITPCGTRHAPTVGTQLCSFSKFVLKSASSSRTCMKFRFILNILIIFIYLRKMQC